MDPHEYEYSRRRSTTAAPVKNTARGLISVVLKLIFSAVIVFMLINCILLRIRLTEQNDTNVKLRSGISEIDQENRRLRIRYESSIDYSELEDTARGRLGMADPQGRQIIKIDYPAQR